MELTKQEFEVLWNIEEGISDTSQLQVFTNFNLEELKKILLKLEKLNLITIDKKFDKSYNEDYWNASTTEKAKETYKKYQKWIPE